MNEKSKLQSSLSRLLKRGFQDSSSEFAWFNSEPARKGRVDLSRAGEERFVSTILDLRSEGGRNTLIIDRLMPEPDDKFWHEPVSLQCKVVAFDAGMEETAEFNAMVGERIQVDEHAGVELCEMSNLERSRREYIAEVPRNSPLDLSFMWFGSWMDVKPKRMSINRFIFDAEIKDFQDHDGYTISQAIVKLEHSGSSIPVKLNLTLGRNGEFETELTKIDSVARQKLTSMIEEVWRSKSGLTQKRMNPPKEKGYHQRSEESKGPFILLLSNDDSWGDRLSELGTVIHVPETRLKTVSERIAESPCDLFIADADHWKDNAIAVERLLRSVSRYRKIPRIWISDEEIGQPWEASGINLGNVAGEDAPSSESDALDHVDYGAFDLMSRNTEPGVSLARLRWAMGGESFGRGESILLVTQNARLRYRMGLCFLREAGFQFVVFHRLESMVPALDKRQPRWILLDASSFEVEIDAMLARAHEWTQQNRGNVIILARGAAHKRVTQWLKRGARDIILLDPSLRETMRRLRTRIISTESTSS